MQLYCDARSLGSLRDVAGAALWDLPDQVADELRVLIARLGPIRESSGV